VAATDCAIDAYLDKEIGGDRLEAQVAPPAPKPGQQQEPPPS
jgi:hypothetical protein